MAGSEKFYERKEREQEVDNILFKAKREKDDFEKEARDYLKKKKFYEKNEEDRREYIVSEEGLKIVISLAKRGFSLVKIANIFNETQKSFYDFMGEYTQVEDAIRIGYDKRDTEVDEALQKMAVGYYITEKRKIVKDTGSREIVETQEYERYIPPNPYAAMKYLENKKSYEYKPSNDNGTGGGGTFVFEFKFPNGVEDE